MNSSHYCALYFCWSTHDITMICIIFVLWKNMASFCSFKKIVVLKPSILQEINVDWSNKYSHVVKKRNKASWQIYLHWPPLSFMWTLFRWPNCLGLEENDFPVCDLAFALFFCPCSRVGLKILCIKPTPLDTPFRLWGRGACNQMRQAHLHLPTALPHASLGEERAGMCRNGSLESSSNSDGSRTPLNIFPPPLRFPCSLPTQLMSALPLSESSFRFQEDFHNC